MESVRSGTLLGVRQEWFGKDCRSCRHRGRDLLKEGLGTSEGAPGTWFKPHC